MLEILPWLQVNAAEQQSSARGDCEEYNSKNPPMHARSTFAQAIAETANSFDRITGPAQLLAQPANVSVNGTGIDHTFVAPNVAEQAIAFLNSPPPLHQRTEQFVLETGKMKYLAIHRNAMAQAVDLDRSSRYRLRFVRGFASTQNCLSTQHDFAWREWFRNIIIGPQFQADNAIDFLGLGREPENRNVPGERIAFETFADFEPGHFRQHQVENDQHR